MNLLKARLEPAEERRTAVLRQCILTRRSFAVTSWAGRSRNCPDRSRDNPLGAPVELVVMALFAELGVFRLRAGHLLYSTRLERHAQCRTFTVRL